MLLYSLFISRYIIFSILGVSAELYYKLGPIYLCQCLRLDNVVVVHYHKIRDPMYKMDKQKKR